MAQGDFTHEELKNTKDAVNDLFEAIPKSRRMNYIGHLNDILLFLGGASRAMEELKQALEDTDGG